MLDDATGTPPTGSDAAPTPAAPADTGTAAPQTPDTGGAQPQGQQPAPKPAEPKDDAQQRLTPFQSRISELVKQGHTERRAREAAEAERDQLRAEIARLQGGQQNQPPGQQQDRPPTREDFDRRVREEATKVAAQQAQQAAWNRIGQEGGKEFTPVAFNAACNTLASLGAGDNPAFMEAVGELDAGHKVLAHLANDPDEAMRVLSLSPSRMAATLGRLEERLTAAPPPPPPKPISAAPAPTRPIGGTGGGSPSIYDPNLTTEQYAELRRKGVKT